MNRKPKRTERKRREEKRRDEKRRDEKRRKEQRTNLAHQATQLVLAVPPDDISPRPSCYDEREVVDGVRAEEGKVGVGHGCTGRPFGPAPKRLFFLGPFDMKMDFWVKKKREKKCFCQKSVFFFCIIS